MTVRGMRVKSGECSISRHRLAATGSISGKPKGAASPLISWAGRDNSSPGLSGKPAARAPRRVEPLAFALHPAREIAGKFEQRLLGARDRIRLGGVARVRPYHGFLERVGRHNHVVIGEGGDGGRGGGLGRHVARAHASAFALSSSGGCLITSAFPPLRRSGPA